MAIDRNTMRILADRGVDLMPPVGASEWRRLEAKYSINVGSDFKAVYSLSNGFLVHDEQNWLMLWSVDQIIESGTNYVDDCLTDEMIPIGDYLLESDIIVARIAEESASVRLLYEECDLAPSLQDFVEMVAAGAFDWQKRPSASP